MDLAGDRQRRLVKGALVEVELGQQSGMTEGRSTVRADARVPQNPRHIDVVSFLGQQQGPAVESQAHGAGRRSKKDATLSVASCAQGPTAERHRESRDRLGRRWKASARHDRGDHGLQDDAWMITDGDEAQHVGRRQRTPQQSQRPLQPSGGDRRPSALAVRRRSRQPGTDFGSQALGRCLGDREPVVTA